MPPFWTGFASALGLVLLVWFCLARALAFLDRRYLPDEAGGTHAIGFVKPDLEAGEEEDENG